MLLLLIHWIGQIRIFQCICRKTAMFGWIIFICGFAFFTDEICSQSLVRDETGWLELANNGQYRLSMQPFTGLPKVIESKSGVSWESNPINHEQYIKQPITAGHWEIPNQSAFIIRYLNHSGNVETQFTGHPECKKQFAVFPSGCRITFFFPDSMISFQAVYTFHLDHNLRITIPFRKISDPNQRLLDIRVLPYFGSLAYRSSGYLVMPDGCGGLIKPDHFARDYTPSRVYGERYYFDKQYVNGTNTRVLYLPDNTNPQNSFLTLPMFGVVKENGAFLARISQGQFQAEIGVEVTPSSLRMSGSPRLIFREVSYDMLGQIRITPVYNRQDRIVDYYFLAPPNISYVGIAQKYRDLLFETRRRPRLNPSQSQFRLRLLMGVNEEYLDTTRLQCLTDFKQVEAILNDFNRNGARRLQVMLVGWCSQGYLGDNPRHFPADRRFGGNNGLEKTLKRARELGMDIGLHFDNSYTYKKSRAFKRRDTVKDIKGVPIDIGFGHQEYLLCPELAWNRYLKSDLQAIQDLKFNGMILFDGINQGLFNCYDKQHPVNRRVMAMLIRNSLEKVSRTNPVAVTVGFDFLYPHAKALYDMPTRTSGRCDEVVPLIPIIYHGWLPYSVTPINLRVDDRREFLKMVEYGAIPNAYLTADSVAGLVYASHNPVFSGKYTDWKGRIIKEYRVYERDLRHLQNRSIIDHRRLAKDVYLTTYDNRVKTIVNYGSTGYSYDQMTVPPMNYAIMR